MSKRISVQVDEVMVTISNDEIVLIQGNSQIKLPWQSFAKLSNAVSKIEMAHAALWRVNDPGVLE